MAQSSKGRSVGPSKSFRKTPGPLGVSKLDQIVRALRAPKGATINNLAKITGWQTHSVRGAIAGALKRRRGLAVVSTKSRKGRVYRIMVGE